MNLESNLVCDRCLMTPEVPGYVHYGSAGCSFCKKALMNWQNHLESQNESELERLRDRIRKRGYGQEHDCIVGVSGGIDSSWVLLKAKEQGFRPLAVHMDNTWNSELANNNIANLITKLDVDLITKVIDSNAFNSGFKALMKANVLDLEILYDNLLHEAVYGEARKRRIPFILSGFNPSTELLEMPKSWSASNKFDAKLIRSAIANFGSGGQDLSLYSNWTWMQDTWLRGIRWERFLDFIPVFDLERVVSELSSSFDFKPYPVKHYENTLTMFFQGYVLPRKHGIDKRRVHLSSLVLTGQMERATALAILETDPIGSEQQTRELVGYVCDRLEISEIELDNYIADNSSTTPKLPSEFPVKVARFLRSMN